MATFQIKTHISAVDNITGPLADINKSIKGFMKPFRDLYNSTQKLKKELGFPKVAASLRGVAKAYSGVASEVKALGTDIAWAVGGATAAVSALAWRTSSVGDAAAKTAQKVGVSTQAWTELAHAGSMSGVAASTLQGGLTRLNKNISEAARGGGKAIAMFDYLGVSIYDADGKLKSADTVMAETADRLKQIDDGAHRSALAAEIFGRSAGPGMIPLLNEGSAGIEELRQEAAALGITFNDVEGKQAEAFGDAMERITAALDGVVFTIGKQLLPPLTEVADKVKAWIVANRELIGIKVGEWIQRITDYLPTLEEKLKALWADVSGFAMRIDGLVQSFGGWSEVMPYIVGGLAALKLAPLALSVVTLTKSILGFGWALGGVLVKSIWLVALGLKGLFAFMLANPITIAIAAIIGTAYLIYDNWEAISKWLKEVWTSWKWAAGETWDWISAKVVAVGEAIGSFLSTLWSGITSAAAAAWNAIVGTIEAIFTPIVAYFTERIDAVKSAFDIGLVAGIQAILLNFHPVRWITDAMNALTKYIFDFNLYDAGTAIINTLLDGLKAAWEGVVGWFKGIGESVTGLIPESVTDVLKMAQGIGGGITDSISGALGSATDFLGGLFGGEAPVASGAVPVEQSEALQFAQQRAARQQEIMRAQASVYFHNVPQNVDIDAKGWTNQHVRYQPPSPLMQSPYNGTRMGGLQ